MSVIRHILNHFGECVAVIGVVLLFMPGELPLLGLLTIALGFFFWMIEPSPGERRRMRERRRKHRDRR